MSKETEKAVPILSGLIAGDVGIADLRTFGKRFWNHRQRM